MATVSGQGLRARWAGGGSLSNLTARDCRGQQSFSRGLVTVCSRLGRIPLMYVCCDSFMFQNLKLSILGQRNRTVSECQHSRVVFESVAVGSMIMQIYRNVAIGAYRISQQIGTDKLNLRIRNTKLTKSLCYPDLPSLHTNIHKGLHLLPDTIPTIRIRTSIIRNLHHTLVII